MSVKRKQPASSRAKKRKRKTPATVPLFIEVEASTSEAKLRELVQQVMDKSGLVFKNKQKLTKTVVERIKAAASPTVSAQMIMGMLATAAEELELPTTPDGLPMPAFNANARVVLNKRYLKKDAKGNVAEQPWEMLLRVARTIAKIEKKYDPKTDDEALARRFYEMMARLEFLPNSPTLMNAGRELGQLSACFVLPVGDSMDSIFEAIKHTAIIHKSGGGTGFSFSRLRPTNDIVKSTKGVSSGPISFMTVFDAATDTIKQGGTRRGANMGILRVDHPDILEFITCKKDLNKLNNFNISVAVTDAFMQALKKDEKYDLVNPRTGKTIEQLSAKKVFDLIVQQAWSNGEPGMIFLDRLNAANPTPELGEIEATNPCGEQPLLPYESCNLGSINLARMVTGDKIDWDKIKQTVHLAVHFLDNVIDANKYPLKEIAATTKGNRKIGLGVMGFAELLVHQGIAYDSKQAIDLGKKIMAFIQKESRKASCELAEKRGPFPNIDKSIYRDTPPKKQPRHATVTTIAPTGTLSILAGTSSGVEPIFALSFARRVLDGEELLEVNPLFESVMRKQELYDEKMMREVAANGSIRHLDKIPAAIRKVFATAHDISPEWHVRMQAEFQKFTDNAVSKTVNFPENATPEQVAEVFLQAYDSGCKGVTIFRYGSREAVLNIAEKPSTPSPRETLIDQQPVLYNRIHPRKRPRKLTGSTNLITIGCGKLYITVNRDEIGMCEVFTSTGRTGGCPSQSEAISRLVSLALRSGIAVEEITYQLQGIRCHSAIRRNELIKNGDRAVSCPAAIALALRLAAGQQEKTKPPTSVEAAAATVTMRESVREELHWLDQGLCPDCHTPIEREGGCVVCRSCGFSKCG